MKLLHVITTLDVGGAEMHLLSQVRGQVERGCTVRVAWLKGEGRLRDDFLRAGAEWVGCIGSGPGLVWRLRKHVSWSDIVHSHLLKADMATAVAATLMGRRRRLLSGKHNDEQVLRRPLVSFVHGLLGNLPARTIVLSDHVGRFIAEHGRVRPDRLTRIYYGLDPKPFERAASMGADERRKLRAELRCEPQDIVFTCVARFAPQKAHEVLLDALDLARKSPGGERLRLLLVGDDPFGDERQKAEAHAHSLGLIENGAAIFAGIRRDVPQILAASDVFVLASRWEGLGLVFLEAMAAGLPVLATRVSAVPEVVLEGSTGHLVPPDDPQAMATAMTTLAGDADLRARLGAAGRARVRDAFGLDRMVDETLDVYRGVLAGAP